VAGDTHVELMVSQEVGAKDRAIDSGQGELPVEPVGPAGRRGEGEGEGARPPTLNRLTTSGSKGCSGRNRRPVWKHTDGCACVDEKEST